MGFCVADAVRFSSVVGNRAHAEALAEKLVRTGCFCCPRIAAWHVSRPRLHLRVHEQMLVVAHTWGVRHNMSIDTDQQQQEAASPQSVVVRSSSRYVA